MNKNDFDNLKIFIEQLQNKTNISSNKYESFDIYQRYKIMEFLLNSYSFNKSEFTKLNVLNEDELIKIFEFFSVALNENSNTILNSVSKILDFIKDTEASLLKSIVDKNIQVDQTLRDEIKQLTITLSDYLKKYDELKKNVNELENEKNKLQLKEKDFLKLEKEKIRLESDLKIINQAIKTYEDNDLIKNIEKLNMDFNSENIKQKKNTLINFYKLKNAFSTIEIEKLLEGLEIEKLYRDFEVDEVRLDKINNDYEKLTVLTTSITREFVEILKNIK
jgi:hypothetical protein